MCGSATPPDRYSRLCAVSISAASPAEARERINSAFTTEQLGSPLPDLWENWSVYFDGMAQGKLVISLRLVFPNERGLPINPHFSIADLALEKPCAEISHFTVLPPFRRRIGSYEWNNVKRYVLDAGYEHLIVQSLIKLENYYQRLGFSRCGYPFFDPSIGSSPNPSGAVNAVPMLMHLGEMNRV